MNGKQADQIQRPLAPAGSAGRITEAEWRALLERFPDQRVPPHYTIGGAGPKYLTTADLVRADLDAVRGEAG